MGVLTHGGVGGLGGVLVGFGETENCGILMMWSCFCGFFELEKDDSTRKCGAGLVFGNGGGERKRVECMSEVVS